MTETAPTTKPKAATITVDVDGTIDGVPKGWTVTSLGYGEGYSVSNDGVNEDGTTGPGCAFKVSKAEDLGIAIQHRGKIPE